jgi:hypothetical protein
LGSSGNTGTLSYTGANVTSTKTFTMATSGTGAFDISASNRVLTLSGVIDGSGSLLKSGELHSVTVGKARRVSSSQVQDFIETLETKSELGGRDVI